MSQDPRRPKPPVVLQDTGPPHEPLEQLGLPAVLLAAVVGAREGADPALAARTRWVLSRLSPLPHATQAGMLQLFANLAPAEASAVLGRLVQLAGEDRGVLADVAVVCAALASEPSLLEELCEDPLARWRATDLVGGRSLLAHTARLATDAPSSHERPWCAVLLEASLRPLRERPVPREACAAPDLVLAATQALLLHLPAEYARLTSTLCRPGGKVKTAGELELGTHAPKVRPPLEALEAALAAARSWAPSALLETLTRHRYETWEGTGGPFVSQVQTFLTRVAAAELPAPLVLEVFGEPPRAYVRAPDDQVQVYGPTDGGLRCVLHTRVELERGRLGVHAPSAFLEAFHQGKTLPTLARVMDPGLLWFQG